MAYATVFVEVMEDPKGMLPVLPPRVRGGGTGGWKTGAVGPWAHDGKAEVAADSAGDPARQSGRCP